jgi:hypothetical protein
LNFSTVTTDFEGDQIYYWWDWGEGNHTSWIGPFNPNEPMTANYSWVNNGTYDIRVKAKDSLGHESVWSEPVTVSIAPQIWLKPYVTGYIYFRFFMFNNSYFYSQLLQTFGLAVIITNRDLFLEAGTSKAVDSAIFTVFSPTYNESLSLQDDNGTDGFSCRFANITSGFYGIILDAYDANGNHIDRSVFTLLYYWRFGSPPAETLHSVFQGHQIFHRSSYLSLLAPQHLNRKGSYFQ